MEGGVPEVELAAFLAALRTKGETADELEGLARRMRARLTPIPTSRTPLLDTCGTGGDELHTFNISTATASGRCGLRCGRRQAWEQECFQRERLGGRARTPRSACRTDSRTSRPLP